MGFRSCPFSPPFDLEALWVFTQISSVGYHHRVYLSTNTTCTLSCWLWRNESAKTMLVAENERFCPLLKAGDTHRSCARRQSSTPWDNDFTGSRTGPSATSFLKMSTGVATYRILSRNMFAPSHLPHIITLPSPSTQRLCTVTHIRGFLDCRQCEPRRFRV